MDFDLLPEYIGSSFNRKYAKKLVVEAFEEDTGLKVGSGDDEDHEDEEEDKDQVGGPGETETLRGSRERLRIRRNRGTGMKRIKYTNYLVGHNLWDDEHYLSSWVVQLCLLGLGNR